MLLIDLSVVCSTSDYRTLQQATAVVFCLWCVGWPAWHLRTALQMRTRLLEDHIDDNEQTDGAAADDDGQLRGAAMRQSMRQVVFADDGAADDQQIHGAPLRQSLHDFVSNGDATDDGQIGGTARHFLRRFTSGTATQQLQQPLDPTTSSQASLQSPQPRLSSRQSSRQSGNSSPSPRVLQSYDGVLRARAYSTDLSDNEESGKKLRVAAAGDQLRMSSVNLLTSTDHGSHLHAESQQTSGEERTYQTTKKLQRFNIFDSYLFNYSHWELFDILRTLAVVVVITDPFALCEERYRVAPLATSAVISFAYFVAVNSFKPFKQEADTVYKATTEVVLFLVAIMGLTQQAAADIRQNEAALEFCLGFAWVVFGPIGCVITVCIKCHELQKEAYVRKRMKSRNYRRIYDKSSETFRSTHETVISWHTVKNFLRASGDWDDDFFSEVAHSWGQINNNRSTPGTPIVSKTWKEKVDCTIEWMADVVLNNDKAWKKDRDLRQKWGKLDRKRWPFREPRHTGLSVAVMSVNARQNEASNAIDSCLQLVKILCTRGANASIECCNNGTTILDTCQHSTSTVLSTWYRVHGTFAERYFIDTRSQRHKVHTSRTCNVVAALDRETKQDVVLKFMSDEDNFRRELDARDQDWKSDESKTLKFEGVVSICDYFYTDPDSCKKVAKEVQDPDIEDFGKYVLVMPMGQRSLHDACAKERFAGYSYSKVVRVMKDVVQCVAKLHEKGLVHGDLKQRNILRQQIGANDDATGEDDNETIEDDVDSDWNLVRQIGREEGEKENEWILCDMDASSKFHAAIGKKTSTAYGPPELARAKWIDQVDEIDRAHGGAVPSFDVWSLGVILYELCAGRTLFAQDTSDDTLINFEDQRRLCVWHTINDEELEPVFASKKESVELRQQFDKMAGESGELNREQTTRLCAAMGHQIDSREFDSVWRTMDGDDSGSVDFEKFASYWRSTKAQQRVAAKHLIRWCLKGEASARPTVEQILKHRFFEVLRLREQLDKVAAGRECESAAQLKKKGREQMRTRSYTKALASFKKAKALAPDDDDIPGLIETLRCTARHSHAIEDDTTAASPELNQDQVMQLCEAMGEPVDPADAQNVMRSIDADSSGFVDFGEFAIYWHNRPGVAQSLGMKYHAFMSHCQGDASGTVSTLYLKYKQLGLYNWLDMHQQDLTLNGMKQGVKDSDIFLLFLTRNLLTRPFCLEELDTAITEKKPIQIVLELDPRFRPFDLDRWLDEREQRRREAQESAGVSTQLSRSKSIMMRNAAGHDKEVKPRYVKAIDDHLDKAVVYRRRDYEGAAMMRELCRRCEIDLPQNIHSSIEAKEIIDVAVIYNDATAPAQEMWEQICDQAAQAARRMGSPKLNLQPFAEMAKADADAERKVDRRETCILLLLTTGVLKGAGDHDLHLQHVLKVDSTNDMDRIVAIYDPDHWNFGSEEAQSMDNEAIRNCLLNHEAIAFRRQKSTSKMEPQPEVLPSCSTSPMKTLSRSTSSIKGTERVREFLSVSQEHECDAMYDHLAQMIVQQQQQQQQLKHMVDTVSLASTVDNVRGRLVSGVKSKPETVEPASR